MVQPITGIAYTLKFFRLKPFNENNIRSFFQHLISVGYKNNDSQVNMYTLSSTFTKTAFTNDDLKISVYKTTETGWDVLNCSLDGNIDIIKLVALLLASSRQLFAEFASMHDCRVEDNSLQLLWLSTSADINQFTPWIKDKIKVKQWDGSTLYYAPGIVLKPIEHSKKKEIVPGDIFLNLDPIRKAEVLRWLLYDNQHSNEGIIETIKMGLMDKHWEVCITATILAARFKIKSLTSLIKNIVLPTSSRSGLNSWERSAITGMKEAAIALLNGEEVPKKFPRNLETKEEKWAHLLQCTSGEQIQIFEKCYLLSIALTNPVLDYEVPVSKLTEGFKITANKFFLPVSGIEMLYIPAGMYWLGNEQQGKQYEYPIRNVSNQKGFFIPRYPVFSEMLKDIVPEDENSLSFTEEKSYMRKTIDEAAEFCAQLSTKEKIDVGLPTSIEWEMAARGQNGLLYPWGCCYIDNMTIEPSPYNIMSMVGVVSQWVLDEKDGNGILMGSKSGTLRCYEKESNLYDGSVGAIRLVARL